MSMGPENRSHPNGYGQSDDPHPHPQDIREAVLREVEKERIREEIIVSEIVRRRVLEAEVRRELMMEREMALRQGSYGFPFGSSPVTGSEPPTSPSHLAAKAGRSAEKTLGMTLEHKVKLKRTKNRGLKTLPFQRGTTDLSISEVKPASAGNKEKQRTLLRTKPDENVSGSKLKDVTTSPEVVTFELLTDVIANKMAKEKWSCALCQVMASSEKDLDAHVLGKKHKSKMAAMRAQRTRENYRIGLFPKKATKSIHVEEKAVKLKAQHLFSQKAGKATSKGDDLPLSKNPMLGHLKKAQADKKSQWSCAVCQVIANSENNINAHVHGKKHKSNVEALRAQRTGKTHSIPTKSTKSIHMGEERLKLKVQSLFIEKPKEWRCALCKVSASSEKGLYAHVLGKKHKANEAASRSSGDLKKPIQPDSFP